VATEKDPATARLGEGFYSFLIRTIPGQWWSALQIELRKPSLKIGDHRFNFVVITGLLQFGFFAVLFYLGKWLAFAYLLQSMVAIFLLEYVNYIEHYGLLRNDGEKLSAVHAWQSDSVASRFSLFELSRHSHHHLQAAVPYPELESMESPHRLPYGYFGMFYIALCPPIWFWVMDRRIVSNSTAYAGTIA
jgi:alkane 1-monooxygenase